LIKNAEDYKKAGLGTFHRLFAENQIKRILFAWIISTSMASLLLAYFGLIKSQILFVILIILNVFLSVSFYNILFKDQKLIKFKKAFIEINAFMIIVLIMLIFESLFN
jgi:heme O synthase-like polyprenyltransferase